MSFVSLAALLAALASTPASAPAPQGFIDDPHAQPASQPAEAAEEDEEEDEPGQGTATKPWYQALGLGGFLDAGFGAMWPMQQNTFFVGEVEVDLDKKLLDVAAVRLDLNLLNRLPWQPLGAAQGLDLSTPALVFDSLIEQAYGEWTPLGDAGPRLRLGKYNALVGYERQDAIDRFMVSQSVVFMNGSPANFTGIALEVPLPASLSLTLHGAVNGWDRGVSSTRTKTVGLKIAFDRKIKPELRLQIAATGLYGTERFANERDYRFGFFADVSLEYAQKFWLAGEATYGQEPNIASGTVPGVSDGAGAVGLAHWWGLAVWLKWRIPHVDWLSLASRYDFFDDPQRTRGLVQTAEDIQAGGLSQRQQVSANVTAVITEGASARIEYNADFVQSRSPEYVRALAVAHRLVLQALLKY